MKIHIILLVLISTFSGEATGIKPCLGKESYLKDTKGSLEQLIFESLRILNCSHEFDPVFRAALEVERNLNSFTDKHLTALLRVADSQIEGQVRQETKEMILAMAAARPGMMSLYDPRKAQQRLEDIYKGIPGENLRALALLLRARVVRDRYPESAEGIMTQFFTEFDKSLGPYSGAIASMFKANILVDRGKTKEAVALYYKALLNYRAAEMKQGIPMEPYLIHGFCAALNAAGNVRRSLYHLRRLTRKFPAYEGISTALMEIEYLEKEILKEDTGPK